MYNCNPRLRREKGERERVGKTKEITAKMF